MQIDPTKSLYKLTVSFLPCSLHRYIFGSVEARCPALSPVGCVLLSLLPPNCHFPALLFSSPSLMSWFLPWEVLPASVGWPKVSARAISHNPSSADVGLPAGIVLDLLPITVTLILLEVVLAPNKDLCCSSLSLPHWPIHPRVGAAPHTALNLYVYLGLQLVIDSEGCETRHS